MYRKAYQAGYFYPAEKNSCIESIQACLLPSDDIEVSKIEAGIVPHAGWSFSGPTAGKVYQKISEQGQPETFVLFGAVHSCILQKPALWSKGSWETPLGDVKIDEQLAKRLLVLAPTVFDENSNAHMQEHSIEVQVPFIKYLFPETKILPIMIPPSRNAHEVGKIVEQASQGKQVIALGSTDLTHYGTRFGFTPAGNGPQALKWVRETNDKNMLKLIASLQAEKVVEEARQHYNACGAGAIAATIAFAIARHKKEAVSLNYTTSWDVYPESQVDSFVGYAGLVF